jgi:hypothetical protein
LKCRPMSLPPERALAIDLNEPLRVLARASGVDTLAFVSSENTSSGLAERERQILDFERESWKLAIAKERAIRECFGFSAARYHQLLNRVLETPEALAYDPMLVRRLRRVREARRRRRVATQLGVRQ